MKKYIVVKLPETPTRHHLGNFGLVLITKDLPQEICKVGYEAGLPYFDIEQQAESTELVVAEPTELTELVVADSIETSESVVVNSFETKDSTKPKPKK